VPTPEHAILPLRFEGVGLRIGSHALLHDLDFSLEPGGCSVILGPNGAGKSLLLRLCDGLLAPTSGTIRWQGRDAARAAEARAMVFQRPVLLRRSASANIDYALRIRGIDAPERRQRVERALADTRLTPLADRAARSLSGGERQRLALARAWATRPSVLFLDEPAAALDPGSRTALEQAIRAMQAEGTKIVLTTHDLDQAARMADEILFLYRGRLLERREAGAFFGKPASEIASKFLQGEVL